MDSRVIAANYTLFTEQLLQQDSVHIYAK